MDNTTTTSSENANATMHQRLNETTFADCVAAQLQLQSHEDPSSHSGDMNQDEWTAAMVASNSSLSVCNITSTNQTGAEGPPAEPDIFYFYETEQLTFLWILFFIIVIGNLAVLAAIVLGKSQRKSRMNFFIMHLALADLSVGLITVLTDVIWKMTVHWYLGNIACKLVKYFQTVALYSSNYVLVALSIDRYDAITHPLKFHSGSWRRARVLIAAAWMLSFIFSSPALFMFQEVDDLKGTHVTQCWADLDQFHWRIYITIVFLILFMIPAIIIAVCYTIMVHTIWTQSRILTPGVKSPAAATNGILRKSMGRNKSSTKATTTQALVYCNNDDDSRRASSRGLIPKAKIKSVKMTLVIVFVFILCSSPFFVFSLLQLYGVLPAIFTSTTINALGTLFQSLTPLNSAANPIIYCLFSTHICRNLRKIKFVNWLSLKLCPSWVKNDRPGSRRKFGPTNYRHPHDASAKTTRSDFTTSMTDSRSVKSAQSGRFAVRHVDSSGSLVGKGVHFGNPAALQLPLGPQAQKKVGGALVSNGSTVGVGTSVLPFAATDS